MCNKKTKIIFFGFDAKINELKHLELLIFLIDKHEN